MRETYVRSFSPLAVRRRRSGESRCGKALSRFAGGFPVAISAANGRKGFRKFVSLQGSYRPDRKVFGTTFRPYERDKSPWFRSGSGSSRAEHLAGGAASLPRSSGKSSSASRQTGRF